MSTSENYPELFGFPQDEHTIRMLAWLDENYLDHLVGSLYKGFHRQDLGIEILAIHSETPPQMLITSQDENGAVTGMSVFFQLQILVKDSQGKQWRLFTKVHFHGDNLHIPDMAIVETDVEIESDKPRDELAE